VLVVLYVAGAGFFYFFRSMKLSPATPEWKRHNMSFRWVAIASVVVVFILGALITGAPSSERARRIDENRINDLRTIQQEIRSITLDQMGPTPVQKEALPVDLKEVQAKAVYTQPNIIDPETGLSYEYTVTSPTTFELCAVFETARNQTYDIFWNHETGRQCFAVDLMEQQR
jgi:hypothetical protein